MRSRAFPALSFAMLLTLLLELGHGFELGSGSNSSLVKKKGRVFSLFNVVTFQNSPCVSTSALIVTSSSTSTSRYRAGTCYTNSQCQNKGGVSSGSCAAGFGTCCVFMTSTCGGSIQQNCTYVRNPGFPNSYSATTGCAVTVLKSDASVCQLRLDFESFSLLGPINTLEANSGGACSRDLFSISGLNTGTANNIIPPICGQNTGQHIYVDVGGNSGDSATLNFALTSSSSIRLWEIKVTQIPCGSSSKAPEGCLQYFTGCTGQITTFNFINTGDASAGLQLNNQCYNSCIRQEEGMCCIQYMPCPGVSGAYSLSPTTMDTTMVAALVDTSCSNTDYLNINGANDVCCGLTKTSRFCGDSLNTFSGMKVPSTSVCTCTPPFMVGIVTDSNSDAAKGAPNTVLSRGLCLQYTQVACGAMP